MYTYLPSLVDFILTFNEMALIL